MNTKEIADKYSLNLDKLNMVVLNSDLHYKKTMFNGIEVADSVELVLEKYKKYDVEKEEKALAEKAAIEEEKRRQEEAKRKEEEEQKKYEEKVKKDREVRIRARNIIVTTGDIKEEYEIIGPVYFQVSNKGIFLASSLDIYKSMYKSEIERMKSEGTMSQEMPDWGFLYGEWSVGQNSFESAFYIAVQELRVRAALVGGDAIISMRQDIDIDTNGFSFFYLQMYGTAVKLKKKKE